MGFSDQEKLSFLMQEIEYATTAIYTDPDDQSAWLYHQWLIMHPQEVAPGISSTEVAKMLTDQVKSIAELFEVEPDCKNCMFFLATYLFHCKKTVGIEVPAAGITCTDLIGKLQQVDPMRKRMYKHFEAEMKGY